MSAFVVMDASLVFKWLVEEDHSDYSASLSVPYRRRLSHRTEAVAQRQTQDPLGDKLKSQDIIG